MTTAEKSRKVFVQGVNEKTQMIGKIITGKIRSYIFIVTIADVLNFHSEKASSILISDKLK